ncbi:hypothetical protein [Burkholderia multivorans]|uniref:hypothetical protein n=1 Tax=Burkholderia multivorans TaxID=87883 RepID=UPI00158D02AC|nr:hypothetical protein [Burkholderia multivorans]
MPNDNVLTDEQRSTLESLARTSTPYEQEVLRSILAAHPGQPEPRECRHCGWMCIPNSTASKTVYPLAQPEPRDEVTPLRVERHSDMSVLVVFSSCRQASVFEKEIAARAQGGEKS